MNDTVITLHADREDWRLLAALVTWLRKDCVTPVSAGARGATWDFLDAWKAIPKRRKTNLPITLSAKSWIWLAYGLYEALESLKDDQAKVDWTALGNEVPVPTGMWLVRQLDWKHLWPYQLTTTTVIDLRVWYKPYDVPQSPSQELRTFRYWQERGELPL